MEKSGKNIAQYSFTLDRNNVIECETFEYISHELMDILMKMGLINPIEDFTEIDLTKEEVSITISLR